MELDLRLLVHFTQYIRILLVIRTIYLIFMLCAWVSHQTDCQNGFEVVRRQQIKSYISKCLRKQRWAAICYNNLLGYYFMANIIVCVCFFLLIFAQFVLFRLSFCHRNFNRQSKFLIGSWRLYIYIILVPKEFLKIENHDVLLMIRMTHCKRSKHSDWI